MARRPEARRGRWRVVVSLGASVASAADPWAVQSRVGLTDARLALNSVLMPRPNLSWIDYRSGVMASGDTAGVGGSSHMAMRVKPAASGMAVTVEAGNAVINTPGMGAYMCALDSLKTLPIAASSSTTSRIDLVIARVYDDLNPAIASSSGARKFAVEIWQGDAATGTPTRPTPTPNAGWHPLAAVAVNKNAATITAADVTDLRGPGLVARGGMRALYGADADPASPAFTEPGAYVGDQRWVDGNAFAHQVYFGAGDDPVRRGWRGVHNAQLYTAAPPAGERTYVAGSGKVKEFCRVTIPYPGTPFMVYPTARVAVQLAPYVAASFRTSVGSATGAFINFSGADSGASPAETIWYLNIAPMMWGPFTDTTDIVLSGQINRIGNGDQARGFSYRGSDTDTTNGRPTNFLSCLVYPATIGPVFT